MDDGSERTRTAQWAATMAGHVVGAAAAESGAAATPIRLAHHDSSVTLGDTRIRDRRAREELEGLLLIDGATRSVGAGDRLTEEAPDPERTCFERDRDRILHGNAFRRLAGKTQVFVKPADHQRTRLTHAIEVAQVASAIARSIGVNVALTEAIALGHDCGHGPGGHASEDAFSPYVAEGYDHAVWGADTVLAPLNLCTETLDGIRNHSWSRPAPSTAEGEVVSWADRIAYVCHDFEDALGAGIVDSASLPESVQELGGARRSRQLDAFISNVVTTARATSLIGMDDQTAQALADFRRFNYDHIYMRPEAIAQSQSVIRVLQALVEHHAANPAEMLDARTGLQIVPGDAESLREAVTYVGGMTDQYAFDQAVRLLGWNAADLPVRIA